MNATSARRVLVFVSALALASARASAGTLSSASGYSFEYPARWQLATAAELADMTRAAGQFVKDIESSKVDAYLYLPHTDPKVNINVVITPGRQHLSHSVVANAESTLKAMLKPAHVELLGFYGDLTKINGHDVLSTSWELRGPGVSMRSRQIAFPTQNSTIVITMTAGLSTYAQASADFDAMMQSVKIDQPADAGLFAWDDLPPVVRRHALTLAFLLGLTLCVLVIVFKKRPAIVAQ